MFAQELRVRGGMLSSGFSRNDFDLLYPVGTVYISVDPNFDPNHANGWYGVWVELTDGYYLRTASSDENLGSYYSHTSGFRTEGTALSANEIPQHQHWINGDDVTISTSGIHNHYISAQCADDDRSCHTHKALTSLTLQRAAAGTSSDYIPYYRNMGIDVTDTIFQTETKQDALNLGHTTAEAELNSGFHSHTITATCVNEGNHTHTITGYTAPNETYGYPHDHYFAFSGDQLKPRYCAIKMWKRAS